ncbi:SRPBCC domain-containing protein [Streptosporangium canum]|uniref:SRPBCC domain-containing protein n=1 Tax=Streptosporangium canum TaxID=324952 RepID=UPI0033B58E5F
MSKLFYRGPSLPTLHADYAARHRIDTGAPVTSESSVIIDATPAQVWEVMADLRNWPAWAPGYEVLELDEMAPGAEFRWRLGGVRIKSRFAVVAPDRELTWSGVVFGYKAVDQQVLEALPGGRTRVTMRESLAGPLVSLFFGVDKLRAGHDRYLAALTTELTRRSAAHR